MTKFHGAIGFGTAVKTAGVTEDVITEKTYSGDLIRPSRQSAEADKVNDDVTLQTSISIVANGYIDLNFRAIRYAVIRTIPWKVMEVTFEHPRIILRLGGVWNGPRPKPPVDP